MKKKIMAVYDVDSRFAERFAEAVDQKERVPFTVIAFSSIERLKRFSEEEPIEILLIDAKLKAEAAGIKAGQVVLLSDGEVIPDPGGEQAVYKYQSTDHIIREVMACYSASPVQPLPALVGDKSILVGVYSPINRCLKTSFSLVLGQILAKDSAVLYLNLEDCSGLRKLLGQSGPGDLSDLLYYHSQGGFSWARLKSLVYSWGSLDYILPARYPEDLCQVSGEQMAELLSSLAGEGMYDTIIVDLGQFGKKAADILKICDGIYMPVRQDKVSVAKIEEFEEYILVSGHEKILEKVQRLKLPYPNSFGGQRDYLEQLLWGELGDYVRQLLKGK